MNPGYAIKSSDGEVPVMALWGILSSTSLPLLRLRVVVPVRVPSMGQTELPSVTIHETI